MEKNGHTVRDKAVISYDESAKSPCFHTQKLLAG